MNPGALVLIIPCIFLGLVLYFTPWLVASHRNHKSNGSIFVLNLFTGWTFLGWVGSLIWAMSDNA